MAIVQVSRITNRKGLTENLPQLAGAELGWAVDSRRLFIGNGTLQEGAPVIGNTEILTEFSDITVLSDYTYSDSAVGYSAQTGPTALDPVIRTVQEKLDDFANVRDFGAVGDGVADDTAAINRALYQLYCRENNSQVRRTLYFPAGTYLVTESIIIPSYAKLQGEGADCTIIELSPSVDISSLTAYVARYGDSLQQTGGNIGDNGATPPRNIEISSMTFYSPVITDVFLVEDAQQCYFDSVNFLGPFTTADIIDGGFAPSGADDIAGVRFASTLSLVCTQITFDKCRFSGTAYGFNSDQQVSGVTVSNSAFDTLYQGIVLGTGTVVNGGATGFRAVQNIFDNIYAQGIIYGDVSLNASAYNIFYNVGNSIDNASPTHPVIVFNNNNSVSISDMFQRTDAESNVFLRVEVSSTNTSTVGSQLQLGTYARENGRTLTMTNATANEPIFEINSDDIKAFSMDYTITRSTSVRHGRMRVVCGTSDGSIPLQYTDDYTEIASTSTILAATQTLSTLTVQYTTNNAGPDATLTYSITHLA